MQNDLSKRTLLVLLLLALVAWFGTLDYRKLIKTDEGRYAEISREMVVSGDWLTPRLNGIKYFEKPPLQYWATAAAFKIFGFHAWTARLWTALAGFLTVLVVWWSGRKFFGAPAGNYAAMVLISNLYFVAMGHFNALDMGLTLFTTLALAGFCFAQRDGATQQEQKLGMLLTWAAMAFAVLSKGLVGIVLPGVTLVLYSLLARDWAPWRRLYLIPGMLLFLAIAAPWFVAVSIVNPEFPWFFFIREHFLRYATDEARREGPVYYFVRILLVGMLPWIVVMLDTLWRAARGRDRENGKLDRPALILLIWTIFVFVFFSISRSKLPSYILPIFPALALLMGKRLAALDASELKARIMPVGLIAVAGLFFIAKAADYAGDSISRPLLHQYAYWLYAAVAVTLIGVIYCWYQSIKGRKLAALTGFSAAGLVASLIVLNGHNTFAPTMSSYDIAQKVRPLLTPGVPFYSVRTYDQTLPFYLNRTLMLVDYRDEFDYGLKQQPELAIDNMDDFRSRWAADKQAFALMTPENHETLRGQGLPMEIVLNDGKRMIVKKPEAVR
ncbi:MAG: glycosyltransferase family 39 protein [Burkholderiales bacterium]|nr:glycosyltransferase family 39 protein [Burkholderiales bacterium]